MFLQPHWSAHVTGAPGHEVITSKFHRKGDSAAVEVSSREIREAFLSVISLEDAVHFFTQFGPLDQTRECPMVRLRYLQERIRSARELAPREFFKAADLRALLYERQPWPCKLLVARAPFLGFEAFYVEEAMLHANYVDQIAGVRAATCPECKSQFALPQRKKKTYCTNFCQRKAGKARWKIEEGKRAKAAK